MTTRRPRARAFVLSLLFASCSGSINCGGCLPAGLTPIPGGFNEASLIERALQVRMTDAGMTMIENRFADLTSAYAAMSCGAPDDVACPTAFGMSCDALSGQCVNAMGNTEPVLGFAIDYSEDSSGATICRDDPTDINRRDCAAWLRLEGLELESVAPDQLIATINARIVTSDIPIFYDPLNMDCVVVLDSTASGPPAQDIVITVEINEWAAPGGSGGRQLNVNVVNLEAAIADDDISIRRDPVHGSAGDLITCGLGNVGRIKQVLVERMTEPLRDIIDEQIKALLGWRCTGVGATSCPSRTSCDFSDGLCKSEVDGSVVPQVLGLEGRINLGDLVSTLSGVTDLSFRVGGPSSADPGGLSLGVLGGVESPVTASCVTPLPNPTMRPGFTQPRPFPTDPLIDLDFDGTVESSYMIAAGIPQQTLDEMTWMLYSGGMLCGSISSYTVDLINTGSLSVLMPSLRRLTHADRFSRATAPARVAFRPGAEPHIRIGSGETGGMPGMPTLVEPLMTLEMQDFSLYFGAMVEERWVHLMTVTLDIAVPIGMFVTPANGFELLLGDIEAGLTNIRISDAKILAETDQELSDSIPALVGLILPQITQFLAVPFTVPPAADLGGFDVTVLGIRGVDDGAGGFDNVALYADMDFDRSQAPNLTLAVQTEATVKSVDTPDDARPTVQLGLTGHAPRDATVEFSYRLDNGLWSPFFTGTEVTIRDARLMIQGRHHIEVRGRMVGAYKTLDPTPARVEVVIDTQPPELEGRLAAAQGGVFARAYDVVSREAVRLELAVDGLWRPLEVDEDTFANVPEVVDAYAEIAIAATDEQGLRSEVVLRPGRVRPASSPDGDAAASTPAVGCRCAGPRGQLSWSAAALLLAGATVLSRRRRR